MLHFYYDFIIKTHAYRLPHLQLYELGFFGINVDEPVRIWCDAVVKCTQLPINLLQLMLYNSHLNITIEFGTFYVRHYLRI